MVLVPETMLIELKGKLPKSPEFQSTLGLGYDLDKIQTREDLSPEEKAALYAHQLFRYRKFLGQARNEGQIISAPPIEQTAESETVPDASETSEVEENVVKSVSTRMQKKAGLILDHLKKSKVIKWNKDGEISYRGKPIPQSNIVDLVSNTLKTKSRKGFTTPAGTNEFAQALKETNVPKDYVQNPDLIKAMQRPGKISTPRPLLAEKDDADDNATGFYDASNITPTTPKISRKKEKRDILDFVFSPTNTGKQRRIRRWETLRKSPY